MFYQSVSSLKIKRCTCFRSYPPVSDRLPYTIFAAKKTFLLENLHRKDIRLDFHKFSPNRFDILQKKFHENIYILHHFKHHSPSTYL